MAAQGATWSPPSEGSPSSVSPPEQPPTPSSTSGTVSKSPLESKLSTPSPLLRWPCPEDSLPTAVFYGPLDAKNPLLASCEKDIRELLGFMKKKALATSEEQKHEFRRRCATTLFNIWTKYAPRLPADYYNEKLLKVGDSLCRMKEYKLALLQCYGRYLQQFATHFDENKADVNQFKAVFFPKGFGDKTAGLTFHALSGKNICNYQLVCDSDVNLQNKDSVSQCLQILSSLRLIMQAALPQERLCWIVFNGTIYIYTICRKLMIIGYSSKALEFLLWASVCMESSVPLLAVRYLTWRATLYTAVCQCYHDCQAGLHGEAFARRALAKIDELRQMELMSSSQSQDESRRHYREATIKMAVMIFKRGVFESRRKNKAYFRPKTRVNLKETQSLPWPRTSTERLLDEMFDGTASRFLAVLEALSDSNRRILQTGPLVTDEVELRDVVSELFMAGKELLIISNTGTHGMLDFPETSLWELMIERKNIISMDAAVKFIKLAFTYEEWGLFESSAEQLSSFLQRQDDPEAKKAEKDLTLLLAIEPLINVRRNKGLIFPLENYKEGQAIQLYLKNITFDDTFMKICGYSEDIFHLAAILYFCVCASPQNVQPDKEIVVDMIMFLWQKCKLGIHRISLSRNDYTKVSQKISSNKWVYLMWQINEVIHAFKMEDFDIVVVAEVTLRLTEILEFLGSPPRKFKKSLDTPLRKGFEELPGTPKGILEVLPILKKKPLEQLFFAYELLDKAIGRTNLNCLLTALPNGSSVIDHCYVKVSWYCILGCKAEGSYGKVRLNNNHLPNSGEAIPADGKSIFEVKGLEANEKYIFAIAAYSSDGKLVGNAVGETTKPILVYPSLSAVTARMYLTQVAYQIGHYELAKKVFSPVWDYFVASPSQDEQSYVSLSNVMMITQRRLHSDILAETSSILLYLFLRNIFLTSDIKIKEENLFCDNIKGNEIFPAQQIARLVECERVLVALELSNFLNDSNYALQAVTQCYGLLAPIIYHNIALVPVVQILRSWKEYDLAVAIINYGKKMLDITPACKSLFGKSEQEDTLEESSSSKKPLKTKKPQQILSPEKINEQLALLETHLLKLTKQLMKFKQRPRFLEFFTHIMLKCINEEKFHLMLEITTPVCDFMKRRNESLLGIRKLKIKDGAISGKTSTHLKFKATAVEFVTSTETTSRKRNKRKETLRDFYSKNPSILELTEYESFRSCDPNLFSLYNSGTVLPTGKMTVENYKAMLDFLLTAKKRKANLPSDAAEFSAFTDSRSSEENMSKAHTFHDSDSQSGVSAKEKDRAPNLGLDYFMKIFLYCRRAMVLAHRGGYWTLLQNCCRALWNFTQELQILLSQAVDLYKMFPVSQDGFLCTSVLPFYLGAELLIDMLVQLQNTSSIKSVEDKGEFSVPSYYGNIKSDNGGSSLTFEDPLDDVNVVDLKWIHDFVLKSLEVLYQVEKWETLASLAIQFNMISHERYTEQVTPLLVYAQHQLLLRIQKFNGPDVSQQPCARYEAEHGEKLTCRNFMGKQLKIDCLPSVVAEAGGTADALKALIYSEYIRAKQLVSVPVDVTDTLRCFRETLEKSKYHNRSFRHSRKLLSLLLAQTQVFNFVSTNLGEKGGINNEKFSSGKVDFCLGIEEMHMSTPPDLSQEHFRVFSSVEKSKLSYSQLGLVISSYHRTIDVLQASNQRSLKVQALHTLGNLLIFAEKERFIKTMSVKKRVSCCILSALLFQGLLRTTLPHPRAEHCYAQYEITQLLPGVELFSDTCRADICSVAASLYYVIRELHFVKHNLIIEVLIDLGFFSEAFFELMQIFNGRNMPCSIPSCCKVPPKIKTFQLFDSGKPLTSRENMQALEELITKSLPQTLVTIGRQHLLNKFCFVKAYFLLSVAATINCIPDNSLKTLYSGLTTEKSRLNLTNLIELHLKDDRGSFCPLMKVKDESTLSMIKSILLMEAEDKLNLLVSEAEHAGHENLSQCPAGELEIVVEARLQLAAIALQRHQAAYSAAIVYSTLKLLQDSKLFKKKVVQDDAENPISSGTSVTENKDDNELLDPISLNAREYFNIHLWLRCRLALVTAFVAQIRGIGIVKENDMTDCLSLIKEVCVEATSADDTEMEAEFLMQAVILGLQEKHLKADIITNLQDIIHLLEGNEFISPRSWLTLARSLVLLDDLTKAEKFRQQSPSSKTEILKFLTQAHNILIEQMLTLGETIEFPLSNSEYANPLQPLKNIWLPHVMLLAKIKMRIGHTLAKQAYHSNKRKDSSKWVPALHLFEVALRLCKTTVVEEREVEAEILFQKETLIPSVFPLSEKVLEVLFYECLYEVSEAALAVNLLIGKKSSRADTVAPMVLPSIPEFATVDLLTSYPDYLLGFWAMPGISNGKLTLPRRLHRCHGWGQSQGPARQCGSREERPPVRRTSSSKEPVLSRFELCSLLAWIAVRAATQVSEAALAVNLLIGKKSSRADTVAPMVLPSIPEFATVDLLTSYPDYLLDNYQVTFQTCSAFLYQNDDLCDGTVATENTQTKVDITWVLLLRYYIHLQRINNMSKLLASATPGSGISLPDDTLLTSLHNNELILRQKEMHFFLKKFLHLYSSSCIDEFPKELLQGMENLADSEKASDESSAKLYRDNSLQSVLSLRPFANQYFVDKMSAEMATQALGKELCFQWYIPPLDRPPEETEPMVTSLPVVLPPASRVISIHEKLSNLAQIAEISLPSIPEITSDEDVYETKEMEEKPIDTDIEVPFDVSLPSIFNLERLFDVANGCLVSGGSLFNWMVSIIP
ncbi:hypothetical protein H920_07436 [Fukomys damarensis]|uniref:Cilia- and flagella-associated protein 54 n=1 Tax=Fukomys damarensis TaxID=885580 RepID=A0A091DJ94_FUKDA|nr:hypothetical protein H920_07436 [Fukomys damarensis]